MEMTAMKEETGYTPKSLEERNTVCHAVPHAETPVSVRRQRE